MKEEGGFDHTAGIIGVVYISKEHFHPLKTMVMEFTENEYENELILSERVIKKIAGRDDASSLDVSVTENVEVFGLDNNEREFDQVMEDTINRIDGMVEQYERTRNRSFLLLALIGAISIISIWSIRSRSD